MFFLAKQVTEKRRNHNKHNVFLFKIVIGVNRVKFGKTA